MTVNKAETAESLATTKLIIDFTVYEQFVEFSRREAKLEWGGILLGNFTEEKEFYANIAILP
ncbi:MAG: hypothetical protein ACXAC7_21575, partial [Candidatus Hodarchaeales archaeon]